MSYTHEYKKGLEAKIIAQAWKNPHFREKLLSRPQEALKELGYAIPKYASLKIVEELVLPKSPIESLNLSEEQLVLADGKKATGAPFPPWTLYC